MAKAPAVRSAYIPHERVYPHNDGGDVSLTRQEFADECDINVLMDRFQKTGMLPGSPPAPGQYFDTDLLPGDFREAMDILNAGTTAFMSLPAKVRKEFDNDPAQFVDFAVDPQNIDKLREWGLADAVKPPDAPMRVEVVNPAPPPPAPPEPPKPA